MITAEHSLKNGSYFHILNRERSKEVDMALTFAADFNHPQLCFKELDQTSHDQIWMIEEIGTNKYEIVHAYSTLVLTVSKEKAWMAVGTQSSNQQFFVQKSDPKNNPHEYWIKGNKLSDLYFQFEIRLKCCQSNPKASKCRWELKKISQKNQIFQGALLQFAYSGLYMDVPQASMQAGTGIIQYTLNSRCNQRWKLIKDRDGEDFRIVSVRSKMCLTVKGGKDYKGTPIVQETSRNSPAQLWTLIHQGLSLYIIASKLKKGRFLGVYYNSMDQGAQLVLTNKEQYAFWRVVGPVGVVPT